MKIHLAHCHPSSSGLGAWPTFVSKSEMWYFACAQTIIHLLLFPSERQDNTYSHLLKRIYSLTAKGTLNVRIKPQSPSVQSLWHMYDLLGEIRHLPLMHLISLRSISTKRDSKELPPLAHELTSIRRPSSHQKNFVCRWILATANTSIFLDFFLLISCTRKLRFKQKANKFWRKKEDRSDPESFVNQADLRKKHNLALYLHR